MKKLIAFVAVLAAVTAGGVGPAVAKAVSPAVVKGASKTVGTSSKATPVSVTTLRASTSTFALATSSGFDLSSPVALARPATVSSDYATLLPLTGPETGPFSSDGEGRLVVTAPTIATQLTLSITVDAVPDGMLYVMKLRKAGDPSTGINTGFSLTLDYYATTGSAVGTMDLEVGTYEVVAIPVWVFGAGGDANAIAASLTVG